MSDLNEWGIDKIPHFIYSSSDQIRSTLLKSTDNSNVPTHIAIIMDGNGRWARSRNLDRSHGHIEGVKRVEEIVGAAQAKGVKVLTLYTFSTENWNRPESEISMLMNILTTVLQRKMRKLEKDNIKFQYIGRRERIPVSVLNTLNDVQERTKDNTGLIVNLAFNYGARLEILDAVKTIAQKVKEGKLKKEQITEDVISEALYTKGLPDPDLLIRTSGEKRISNFLLWQLSYAELYFTEKYWPDFDSAEFEKAITDYQNRERRYGAVTSTGERDE